MCLLHLAAAPFNDSEAVALKRCECLRLNGLRPAQWLPRHEYAEDAVRCRINVQLGGICVRLGLERNKVVRVILHFRQPVHDKFVVLLRGKADFGQRFAEKIRRVRSGDAEACGEVVVGLVLALPEQVEVFVSVFIVPA